MRAILHIGTEKTGTTSLQNFLYANISQLQSNNVNLMKCVGNPNNSKLVFYVKDDANIEDHFFKVNKIFSKDIKKKFFNEFEKSFENEINLLSRNTTDIIFSSEFFHSRIHHVYELEKLKEFLNRYFDNILIVCYFREQTDLLLSAYSTHIKSGGLESLNTFYDQATIQNKYYNYLELSDLWSQVFGKNNYLPLIYSKKNLFQEDIRKDFLYRVFPEININRFNFPNDYKNMRLGNLGISLIKKVNQFFPIYDAKGNLNLLHSEFISAIENSKALISDNNYPEIVSNIYKKFSEVNCDFFRKYNPQNGESFEKPNQSSISNNIDSYLIDLLFNDLLSFFEKKINK